MKKLILISATISLAFAFIGTPAVMSFDTAYAKEGKDKGEDVPERSENDRSSRGSNNDERRRREDGGGRDDDGRGRGRGQAGSAGADDVDVVETALEFDDGNHGPGNSDALQEGEGTQDSAKNIDRYLKNDNFERF